MIDKSIGSTLRTTRTNKNLSLSEVSGTLYIKEANPVLATVAVNSFSDSIKSPINFTTSWQIIPKIPLIKNFIAFTNYAL